MEVNKNINKYFSVDITTNLYINNFTFHSRICLTAGSTTPPPKTLKHIKFQMHTRKHALKAAYSLSVLYTFSYPPQNLALTQCKL